MKDKILTDMIYKRLSEKDLSSVQGKLAIQVNLTGKIGGVFYIEIIDGVISVMPYEYIDRDATISVAISNLQKIVSGKLDVDTAIAEGKMKVEGNIDKLLLFKDLIQK